MIDETLEAIRGSIKKWSLIVHLNGEDNGKLNCPLCYLFNDSYGCQGCQGCPVYAYTGNNYCESTPYQAWHDHNHDYHRIHDYHNHYTIKCPECRTLAQEELMFLQSVLERYKEEEK